MANELYPKFKELALGGGADLVNGVVKLALIDVAQYTYSPSHQYFASAQAAVVSLPQSLVNKTVTNGVFDADDVTFPSVLPAGTTVEALILFLDTGTAATSPLIAFFDQVTGLPFLANGGAAEVRFDNGPNKIFAL